MGRMWAFLRNTAQHSTGHTHARTHSMMCLASFCLTWVCCGGMVGREMRRRLVSEAASTSGEAHDASTRVTAW